MYSFIQKHIIIFSLIICFCLYLPLMFTNNVGHDEICSLIMANLPFTDLFHLVLEDGHPPLFAILLKFWMMGTDMYHLFFIRCFPLLWIFLTALLGVFPIKRLFGYRVGLLFFLTVLFMPGTLFLALDIRMYGMALFGITASLVYACAIVQDNKKSDWLKLGFVTLLAINTHYVAAFTVGLTYIFCFARFFIPPTQNKRKALQLLGLGCILFILYIPILYLFHIQSQNMYDLWFPKLEYIESVFSFLMRGTILRNIHQAMLFFVLVLMGTLYFSILYFCLNYKKITVHSVQKQNILMVLCVFLSSFIGMILISYFVRPMLIWRYLTPLYGCLILVGVFVFAHDKKLTTTYLALLFLSLMSWYPFSFAQIYDPLNKGFTQKITQDSGSIVLANSSHTFYLMKYYKPSPVFYLPFQKELIFNKNLFKEHQIKRQDIPTLEKALHQKKLYYFATEGQHLCNTYLKNQYDNGSYCLKQINKDELCALILFSEHTGYSFDSELVQAFCEKVS